ncbi:gamma-2-syntrophin-like isoform X2 [Actinia tenebrosa]|uniref:Gamma-2-syntrophin-like isoform X2 n=1 Tax=Actinia tenebrosa TaxID=6105 RepID=A0A6P8HRI5_ACTTE|nr:gamma-2-syntrophin-like isoform X2 [Actinia tenebrosa]
MKSATLGYLHMQVNRGELQKVRVKLSREALTIQKEGGPPYASPNAQQATGSGNNRREVRIARRKVGGLGMSIRGGKESNLPIAISKIYKNQAAAATRQLYEGDIIVEVNNQDMTNATHDEAVVALKESGPEVVLVVEHPSTGSLGRQEKQANGIVRSIEESSERQRFMNSTSSDYGETDSMSSMQSWTDNIILPLTFASISRYKTGEDNLRSNAFEVSSMDGGASVVLYSENSGELLSWYTAIKDRISMLLDQSINMSNSSLPSAEQIIHMCWVWERIQSTTHWNVWKRKFMTIKGCEIALFEMPPVVTRDWLQSEITFNLMEIVFHVCREDELLDKRENCFYIQTCTGESCYFSVDTQADCTDLSNSVHRATHISVAQVECRTFPGKWHGRAVKLVLDLKRGLRLYSAEDRTLLWQYRFSYLRGSSDDGHKKITLLFSPAPGGPFDRQELEFTNMQLVLTVMHAFYAAKVAQVDPKFVMENSF